MAKKIKMDQFEKEIKRVLAEYGQEAWHAVNGSGLDAAEKEMVSALSEASPVGETGKFKKGWVGSGKKYKMVRYVGNKTKVKGRGGSEIPLLNILEYSTTRGNPFIDETVRQNENRITAALVSAVTSELT